MAARLARDRMVIRLQYGVKSGLREDSDRIRSPVPIESDR